jgi:membrane protein YdbS with pleckstrin-like domain
MPSENIPSARDEIVYYKGQASGIGPILKTIKATVVLALVIYVLSLRFFHSLLNDISAYLIYVWAGIFLSWIAYIAWAWWGWNCERYTLSNKRVTFERGRLAKTIKSIELWRVREIIFHRTFFDAIFGVGKMTLVSKDSTAPRALVGPIRKALKVYEALSDAREVAIAQRGVMAVEG